MKVLFCVFKKYSSAAYGGGYFLHSLRIFFKTPILFVSLRETNKIGVLKNIVLPPRAAKVFYTTPSTYAPYEGRPFGRRNFPAGGKGIP